MNSALNKIYASPLWADIQKNFAGFDDLIEDAELRDFYKRLIWEMISSATAQQAEQVKELEDRVEELEKLNWELRNGLSDIYIICDKSDKYNIDDFHRETVKSCINIVSNALNNSK